jgi:uncharacterized YigZ family protein
MHNNNKDTMRIINAITEIEEKIKKSRFLGFMYPCDSESDVQNYLNHLGIQHPAANHIAFAYKIKTEKCLLCRFNDAGEPSGTAGKPIFNYIEGNELINVLIVVVRYFGGIKLGAGGLSRAYGNTAKQVIDAADISEYIQFTQIKFTLDYSQFQLFKYRLKKISGSIIDQQFSGKITLLVQIPQSEVDGLLKFYSP